MAPSRPSSQCTDAADYRTASAWQKPIFLNALGYVSLVVDSFVTRRIVEACTSPPPDRHADALGALKYVAKLPYVDPKRIALVGRSQGGIVALQVASTQPVEVYEVPGELAYKAVAALYP
jgi:dienelactone hydrolase